MKYNVKTTDGDTAMVECEWIATTSDWVTFYRLNESALRPTTVNMVRSDQVLSVVIVE